MSDVYEAKTYGDILVTSWDDLKTDTKIIEASGKGVFVRQYVRYDIIYKLDAWEAEAMFQEIVESVVRKVRKLVENEANLLEAKPDENIVQKYIDAYNAAGSPKQTYDVSLPATIKERIRTVFPGVSEWRGWCPDKDCQSPRYNGTSIFAPRFDLFNIIIHLNDSHLWTREDIADWLESLDCDITLHSEGV